MAALLESVTISRSSGFRADLSYSTIASSVSSFPISQKVVNLLVFNGLRIQSRSSTRFSASESSRIVRRVGGIVCEAQKTALEVPNVTEKTWQSLVLENDLTVLVEFWAPWCGPCRVIHPVIDELAKQYVGKLKCFKLNTDESPAIATQYGIRSIPTVMIFKKGEKKDAVIGAVPKTTLTASIEKFL
ncbi:hypothetical protein HHK36_003701 [Tetracentron sinense]|uniref:Thioredoxin domain-containing protein n=1 Tax=Tetracentron sinense TaxID=13715 RepID=A0A834ZTW5_TETSI|nr:hypothetical protein HHK36_003701 [Tetracentron sinense]